MKILIFQKLIFDQDLEIVLEKDDLAELFESEFILMEIPSINVEEGCLAEDDDSIITKPKNKSPSLSKMHENLPTSDILFQTYHCL